MSRITENAAASCSSCYLFLLFAILVLSACTGKPIVKAEQPVVPAETVVAKPVVPELPREPEALEPEVTPPLQVDIVLSADVSVYKEAAEILRNKLNGEARIYALGKSRLLDNKVITDIQSSDSTHLVAIGMRAARAVSRVEQKPVIFAYVLNYRDHGLLSSNVKGVSALPGAQQLFRDWKAISPQIRKVAVITGANFEHYIKHAARQAATNKIDLLHFVVNTDKEFLYQSKKLPGDIQGQWIIPDNRILSRKVLIEVLTYNAKLGKQTVVFSPKLLDLGGLFYSRISHEEIAEKIYQRLLDSADGTKIPGKDVLLLNRHEMGINPVMAKQLGLTIPEAYRKYLHD